MARTSAVIRGSSQCASRPSSTVNSTMVSGSGGNISPDTGARLVGRRAGVAGGRVRGPRGGKYREERHQKPLFAGQIRAGGGSDGQHSFFLALSDDTPLPELRKFPAKLPPPHPP